MRKRVGWTLIGLVVAWTGSAQGQALQVEGGVYAESNSGGVAVDGRSTSGRGVNGYSDSGTGVYAASNSGHGVYAYSDWQHGVRAYSHYGDGVYAWSSYGDGVAASALADNKSAVYAVTKNAKGYAGYFWGRTHVKGQLTTGSGGFKIDHPLEPEDRYLYHSFIESPDMMNVYNGNVVLDRDGEAWVELPEWFEALNRDFRYQLTPIGGFAPVYIAEKISDNRFLIAGGEAGQEVSWQVTGVRQDPWAEAHRLPVEEDKPEIERGTYLHPVEWQQSTERDVEWVHRPELFERGIEEQWRTSPDVGDVGATSTHRGWPVRGGQ